MERDHGDHVRETSNGDVHVASSLLVRVVGLPHTEVGARLGKSEHAVESLLERALTELALAIGTDEIAGRPDLGCGMAR